jgi:hypothetical protein
MSGRSTCAGRPGSPRTQKDAAWPAPGGGSGVQMHDQARHQRSIDGILHCCWCTLLSTKLQRGLQCFSTVLHSAQCAQYSGRQARRRFLRRSLLCPRPALSSGVESAGLAVSPLSSLGWAPLLAFEQGASSAAVVDSGRQGSSGLPSSTGPLTGPLDLCLVARLAKGTTKSRKRPLFQLCSASFFYAVLQHLALILLKLQSCVSCQGGSSSPLDLRKIDRHPSPAAGQLKTCRKGAR